MVAFLKTILVYDIRINSAVFASWLSGQVTGIWVGRGFPVFFMLIFTCHRTHKNLIHKMVSRLLHDIIIVIISCLLVVTLV